MWNTIVRIQQGWIKWEIFFFFFFLNILIWFYLAEFLLLYFIMIPKLTIYTILIIYVYIYVPNLCTPIYLLYILYIDLNLLRSIQSLFGRISRKPIASINNVFELRGEYIYMYIYINSIHVCVCLHIFIYWYNISSKV